MADKIYNSAQLTSTRLLRGEVVQVAWQTRAFNDKQKETLVVSVKNLDRPDLQQPVSVYVDYSDKKPSKWSHFIEALEALGVTLTTGPEQLVGRRFAFDEVTIDFGADKKPGAAPGARITGRQRVPIALI